MTPTLGRQWRATFTGCTPSALTPAGLGAALGAAAAELGLTPVSAPSWWAHADGTATAGLLLAESHAIAHVDAAGRCAHVELFSCAAMDAAVAARAVGAVVGGAVAGSEVCARAPGEPAWRARGPGAWGSVRRLCRVAHADRDAHLAVDLLVPRGADLVHRFTPHGLSWVRASRRAVAVVHTWPEHHLVTVEARGLDPLPDVPGALIHRGWTAADTPSPAATPEIPCAARP